MRYWTAQLSLAMLHNYPLKSLERLHMYGVPRRWSNQNEVTDQFEVIWQSVHWSVGQIEQCTLVKLSKLLPWLMVLWTAPVNTCVNWWVHISHALQHCFPLFQILLALLLLTTLQLERSNLHFHIENRFLHSPLTRCPKLVNHILKVLYGSFSLRILAWYDDNKVSKL